MAVAISEYTKWLVAIFGAARFGTLDHLDMEHKVEQVIVTFRNLVGRELLQTELLREEAK